MRYAGGIWVQVNAEHLNVFYTQTNTTSHHLKRTELQQNPKKDKEWNGSRLSMMFVIISIESLYVNSSSYTLAICNHMYWEWWRVVKDEKFVEGEEETTI